MIDNEFLTQKPCVLVGEELKWFGRAGNMLTMGFGDEVEYIDIYGSSVTKNKLYVHIQCPWRLLHQNRILIGSDDIYIPVLGMDEYEDFIGSTIFDEKRDNFISMTASTALTVLEVRVDEQAGLTLKFDNDFVLETFSCDSNNEELWRLGNLSVDETDLVVTSP